MQTTTFSDVGNVITNSFETLWLSFIGFIPSFLAAIILFILGWIVAIGLGKLAGQIIKSLKVDRALEKLNFKKPLEKAGLELNTGRVFEELVKWFIIIASLMVAIDILKLNQVNSFLEEILLYIPNVIGAAIFLVAGVLVASFLQKTVQASLEAAEIGYSVILGEVTKWAVLIFALFTALIQLRIPAIEYLLVGIIFSFALALGLGGKDIAAEFLNDLKRKIKERS